MLYPPMKQAFLVAKVAINEEENVIYTFDRLGLI